MSQTEPQALAPAPANDAGAGASTPKKRRRHYSVLTARDKLLLGVMVGVPLAIFMILIWAMALVSVLWSFTDWQGIGPLHFVGLQEYNYLFTGYPPFWPAVSHNLLWLLFFVCIATPIGILLAVLLDRPLRGSRIYQGIFFTPVVLSLAVVGFIWELQYSPVAGHGFIDSALAATGLMSGNSSPDWLGDKSINVVIVVVTVIESLRAFDIVYIINHGKNGLELLATLITNTSLSEASLIGFGSAMATVLLVISLVPIVLYLTRVMRSEEQ